MLSYYPLGAQVMTMVLPMGFFILTLITMYFVFSQPHTVPGRQPIGRARPVAPAAGTATAAAAATGFPTATSTGGREPLADRATPPVVGALADDTAEEGAPDEAARAEDTETGKPEDTE